MSNILHVFLDASGSRMSKESLEVTRDVINYIQDNYERNDLRFYRYNNYEITDISAKIYCIPKINDIECLQDILRPEGGSSLKNVAEKARELENVLLLTDGMLVDEKGRGMTSHEFIEATQDWVVLFDTSVWNKSSNKLKGYLGVSHIYIIGKNTKSNLKKALQAVLSELPPDLKKSLISSHKS